MLIQPIVIPDPTSFLVLDLDPTSYLDLDLMNGFGSLLARGYLHQCCILDPTDCNFGSNFISSFGSGSNLMSFYVEQFLI